MSYRSHAACSGDKSLAADGGADRWNPMIKLSGSGVNLAIILYGESSALQFKVWVDGKVFPSIFNLFWRPEDLNEAMPNAYDDFVLAAYDADNDVYTIIITVPWKWEHSLEITCKNPTIGVVIARATIFYDRPTELPIPEKIEDIQEPEVVIDPKM